MYKKLLFTFLLFFINKLTICEEFSKNKDCQKDSNRKIWSMKSETGIYYFYLDCENAFIIYNLNNDLFLAINGDSKTVSVFNANSGFGYVSRIDTGMAYINRYDFESFDLSQITTGNYKNVTAMYDYTARLIPYVVGPKALPFLANATAINMDCARSPNTSTWQTFSYEGQLANVVHDKFQALVTNLHHVYASPDFTLDKGPTAYAHAVSNYYNSPDVKSKFLAEFPAYLIRERLGQIDKEIVNEYYNLMTREDLNTARKQFAKFKHAISRVGIRYSNINDAVTAYQRM